MHFRIRILSSLVCALWIVVFACGHAPGQEPFRLTPAARSMFGMQSGYIWLSGAMLIPAGGQPQSGTLVRVGDQLGIDQSETTSVLLESSIADRHLIRLESLMFSPTGETRVQRPFRFHNKTYEQGTLVEAKLDFNWTRAVYGYKVLDFSGRWLAPKIGIHYIRHEITLNGHTREAGLISNTRTLDGAYPVIGFEARRLMPYGFDACVEAEAIHLITRGFLAMVRFSLFWEFYPNVVGAFGASGRAVRYIEDNQPLNNEWYYRLLGLDAGLSFTF